tara:strand:+ start:578 stop:754 length:177 start_codon:yes stop_codon:yes gene_type:complete
MLDFIGSFFVYRSPQAMDGYRRFLMDLPSRKLKALAGTQTHYSKAKLVEMIINSTPPP